MHRGGVVYFGGGAQCECAEEIAAAAAGANQDRVNYVVLNDDLMSQFGERK